MKKNMFKWNVVALVGVVIGFSSCGEEVSPEKEKIALEMNSEDTVLLDMPELNPDMAYSVPTPNELFAVIKETGVLYDGTILNSTENIEKYSSKKIQALNFGVYFTDLAFASSFSENASILSYFGTIKILSDDLGISNALDAAIYEKVEANLENDDADSLLFLSNETYFKAYSYLEENERGSTLALIVLGGWIESLYIMTNLGEYEEGGNLVARIGEQKLTVENLMGFMMKYQDDSNVAEVMEELADIEELFWSFEEEEGDDVTTEQEGDVYVLSGGSTIMVSSEQYEELKGLVAALRNDIIEGEL
ncbi:MAG: hypothetical protein P8L20_02170 [Flavobacteriales bacterium]|nr:hypothetical protein [Flavobacteriales bacterium]